MKWLVTGADGMLGRDIVESLARGRDASENVIGTNRGDLDITDAAAVRDALARLRPDRVVNCAAFTGVDAAEENEEEALRVNGTGAKNLAAACAEHGARMIHISTDYVFSGEERSTPYPEDHPTRACSAYGRTKLAGEEAVLAELPGTGVVARTAWLYGEHGPGFVRTLVGLAEEGRPAAAIVDQRGQPTWTRDLARQVVSLGREPEAAGVFHCTNGGATTWFELAREVFRQVGADPALVAPVRAGELGRPAPRPSYSVLGHGRWEKTRTGPMRDWRAALREAVDVLRTGPASGGDPAGAHGTRG